MNNKSRVSRFIASRLTSYRDDEEGALTAFAIVMFLMMVVGAGMATDWMRHETYRAELQNALDRGLLAASSLSQDVDPTLTVEEYVLKSLNHTAGTPTINVSAPTAEYTADSRKVTATATYDFNTSFLRIIGIPTLSVIARGVAEQERQRVEVSFVVDISPSMN
ncbi:MAG: Tad domain-containing protein, partial [Pseudomonadota bacterium]